MLAVLLLVRILREILTGPCGRPGVAPGGLT
jgi:hypothetical protein